MVFIRILEAKYEYLPIKKLYKRLKKDVKKKDALDFLKALEVDSGTYREINEPSYRQWKKEESKIKVSLEAYGIFKIKQDIPMVLAVMRDYRRGVLKKKDVKRIFEAIEHFHFVFTAVTSQRSSGGISQMYASSARALAGAASRDDKLIVINQLIKKLKDKMPSYKEFEVNFWEICYTNKLTKQKDLVKYILCGVHQHITKNVVTDFNLMTIEHLAPQSPARDVGCSEDTVGILGNLILIPQGLNDKLGNKDFPTKKQLLKDNGVKLDDGIEAAVTWDDAAIEDRTSWLANLAFHEIWKL